MAPEVVQPVTWFKQALLFLRSTLLDDASRVKQDFPGIGMALTTIERISL
jgi:hypothetical protein